MDEKSREQKNVDWFQDFFVEKYQDLKIAQKMSAGQMGYHSTKSVVPIRNIASILDKISLYRTVDKSHMGHLMETILQLIETNKILGYQIKQLTKTNKILAMPGREEKKAEKQITLQNWIQPGISGLMVGGSPRVITVYPVKRKIAGTSMEPQEQRLWEDQITTSIGGHCGG